MVRRTQNSRIIGGCFVIKTFIRAIHSQDDIQIYTSAPMPNREQNERAKERDRLQDKKRRCHSSPHLRLDIISDNYSILVASSSSSPPSFSRLKLVPIIITDEDNRKSSVSLCVHAVSSTLCNNVTGTVLYYRRRGALRHYQRPTGLDSSTASSSVSATQSRHEDRHYQLYRERPIQAQEGRKRNQTERVRPDSHLERMLDSVFFSPSSSSSFQSLIFQFDIIHLHFSMALLNPNALFDFLSRSFK